MANKYKYNYTFEEKVQEEDREVMNEYYRAKTDYYRTLDDINNIFLYVLERMSNEEVKNALISPVVRLKQ